MILGIVLIVSGVIGIFVSLAVGIWFMKKNNIFFKGKYEGKEVSINLNEGEEVNKYLTNEEDTVLLNEEKNDTIILDECSNETVVLDNIN